MHSIFSYWHFGFATSIFLIGLTFLYLYINHFKLKKQSRYFFAGIFVIIICVASPLHFIGENYLFSAHMVSHVLLLLIAAPLLVAGIEQENKFKKYFLLLSTNKMKIYALCWLTGVGVMWFWHIPYIFNQPGSMHGMGLMYLQWISLLLGGMIFCWPVINPYHPYRIPPVSAVLYLSTACIFCSILGLLITFAPMGTYTHYLQITDSFGYLPMIRNSWKISVTADQEMAGLIMWVPCCFIYLTASMVILIHWFDSKELYEIPKGAVINN